MLVVGQEADIQPPPRGVVVVMLAEAADDGDENPFVIVVVVGTSARQGGFRGRNRIGNIDYESPSGQYLVSGDVS